MFNSSSTAQVRPHNIFGSGNGTIVLDNVVCTGHETGLDKCQHNPPGVSDCSHGEDVGVVCSAGKETTVFVSSPFVLDLSSLIL